MKQSVPLAKGRGGNDLESKRRLMDRSIQPANSGGLKLVECAILEVDGLCLSIKS